MAFLIELLQPLAIPSEHSPRPGSSTEIEDAGATLELMISASGISRHFLDSGTYSTRNFKIFVHPEVMPLPVEGTILANARSAIYLPNGEGRYGDIFDQERLETLESPGIRLPGDADVLVIAQRNKTMTAYMATAALCQEDIANRAFAIGELKPRYGAY